MDYYNYSIKHDNIGNSPRVEVVYGSGISDILGSISKGFFNVISKDAGKKLAETAIKSGTDIIKKKSIDISKKAGEDIAKRGISLIENSILKKQNEENELKRTRMPSTKMESQASRQRIRDILEADRNRILQHRRDKASGKYTQDAMGLVRLGVQKRRR